MTQGVSSKCANYSLFSIQRWKGVFTGVIGYRFTWRYVMIARRGLLLSKIEGERRGIDGGGRDGEIRAHYPIVESALADDVYGVWRRLQVVTDPPVGIRPEINSHTPREKLCFRISLSLSFSFARLFPIPFFASLEFLPLL